MVETAEAWDIALKTNGPTVLALSRQNLPTINREAGQLNLIDKGGYIVYESPGEPKLVLMSTGSELARCSSIRRERY